MNKDDRPQDLNCQGWIGTWSGKIMMLDNPRPEDICIEDIAKALAYQCRFNGHLTRFYSVAEHCLHCMDMAMDDEHFTPRLAYLALLHDAAEAYISDIPGGLKHLLPHYRLIESRVMGAIYEAFGIQGPNEEEYEIVRRLDKMALVTERRDILSAAHREIWDVPSDAPIDGLPLRQDFCLASTVESRYLAAFHDLMGHEQACPAPDDILELPPDETSDKGDGGVPLGFATFQQLFAEISSRYPAAALVCAREDRTGDHMNMAQAHSGPGYAVLGMLDIFSACIRGVMATQALAGPRRDADI